MVFGYNPNDPMCHSVYMESPVPTIGEIVNGQTPNPLQYATPVNPNGPKLAPQPIKDGYYKSDGVDDGRISTFEKIKAFVKGGTYNMVRGLFCDKDGFSLSRTLLSAAGIAAVALTGPIGMAAAGGLGLICAFDNFNNARHQAKFATTDQQAREAYEGYGESAATAGLSLWGGWKGYKGIKAKWFGPKPPVQQPPVQQPPGNTTPTGNNPSPVQNPPVNNTPPVQNTPVNNTPPVQNPPVQSTTSRTIDVPRQSIGPVSAEGYFNEWAPTGDIPKTTRHPYFNEWAPTGDIPPKPVPPKVQTHEYIPDWKPTGNPPKPTPPEYVADWKPTGNTSTTQTPNVDTVIEPDGHFFG